MRVPVSTTDQLPMSLPVRILIQRSRSLDHIADGPKIHARSTQQNDVYLTRQVEMRNGALYTMSPAWNST
jgi:hypothetical protein